MPLTPALWTNEITANLTTANNQGEPTITQLANGNILVSYTTDDQGGEASAFGSDVLGQLFDPLGTRIGGEFRLNSSFSIDNERTMDIAALPDGGFVVVYEDSDPDTGGAISLRIETFDATGAFVQFSDFVEDLSTALPNQISPAIAVSSATSVLVAYLFNFSATDRDVGVRIYNPVTNTFGAQIGVLASGRDIIHGPEVATLANGNYVITVSERLNTDDSQISFAIVSPTGGILTATTAAGLTATNGFANGDPAVAALAGGRFVLTWTESDGTDIDVRAQVFGSSGIAVTSEFLVNGFTVAGDNNNDARVVALADGGFVVLYDDDLDPAGRGQRYDADGVQVGDEFQFVSGTGGEIDAVGLGDGRFAVVSNNGEIRMHIMDTRDTVNDPGVYAPDQWQIGTTGDDVFTGDANAEIIHGWVGNDTITAGGGGQTYFGGADNDTFRTGTTSNFVFGGSGTDTVDFTGFNGALSFDMSDGTTSFSGELYEGFENAVFGNGANSVIGTLAANVLTGGTGADTLFGGQNGDDTLFGGAGNGADQMQGGLGLDLLFGGGGADLLDGGEGNDTMDGGLGNDFYLVDSLGDVIQGEIGFAQGGGIDTVRVFVDNFVQPTNIELVRLTTIDDTANFSVTGNDAPGTLVGNAGNNTLNGRGGNDQINGNAGNDTLVGGEGADTLVGGAGADTFVFSSISNSRAGVANRDVINGFTRAPGDQDIIDLSAIDANTLTPGVNNAFSFIGTAAFALGGASAGQLRLVGLGGPNAVIVEGDINGDRVADIQIFVNLQTTMLAGDFFL